MKGNVMKIGTIQKTQTVKFTIQSGLLTLPTGIKWGDIESFIAYGNDGYGRLTSITKISDTVLKQLSTGLGETSYSMTVETTQVAVQYFGPILNQIAVLK